MSTDSTQIKKPRQNAFTAPLWRDADLNLGQCGMPNKNGTMCKNAAIEVRDGKPMCRKHRKRPL